MRSLKSKVPRLPAVTEYIRLLSNNRYSFMKAATASTSVQCYSPNPARLQSPTTEPARAYPGKGHFCICFSSSTPSLSTCSLPLLEGPRTSAEPKHRYLHVLNQIQDKRVVQFVQRLSRMRIKGKLYKLSPKLLFCLIQSLSAHNPTTENGTLSCTTKKTLIKLSLSISCQNQHAL